MQDVQPRLFSEKDDRDLCKQLVHDIKALNIFTEAGRPILSILEMLVVHRACDDSGMLVVNQLVLPLIQERLEKLAEEEGARKVQAAQGELGAAEV